MFLTQRGFSLSSLILIGVFLVLAIVYGSAVLSIPYSTYKVANIMSGIVKENVEEDRQVRRLFDQRVQFEQIYSVVSSDVLTIERPNGRLILSVEYEHCVDISQNWRVCSDIYIER